MNLGRRRHCSLQKLALARFLKNGHFKSMRSPLASLSKFAFIGVFFLRVGLGALIAYNGFPLLIGGVETYERVGSAVSIIGIHSLHLLFGLASSVIQSVGGLFLMLGILTRGIALLLSIIIGFALARLSLSAESVDTMMLVYGQINLAALALVFIGPGRFSLDRRGV